MKSCCDHHGINCRQGRYCPERALYAPLRQKDGGESVDSEEVMSWFADLAEAGKALLLWGAVVLVGLLVVALV